MKKISFKACGIRSVEQALFCEKLGVDYIGLNFVPTSKRRIDADLGRKISTAVSTVSVVGVFQDQSLEEVVSISEQVDLDYIQCSGSEPVDYIQQCTKPVLKSLAVKEHSDIASMEKFRTCTHALIIDGPSPGSGKGFDWSLLSDVNIPFFLAGGVHPGNVRDAVLAVNPAGIDVASGIESDGQVDPSKIEAIVEQIKQLETTL